MSEDRFLYYLVIIPVLGIVAQWMAWRLRLPSILLLLGFGIGMGSLLGLNPDSILNSLADSGASSDLARRILFPIVTLSVAIILFEGGLSLRISELKQAGTAVFRLCTLGVLVSWVATTFLAKWLFDLDSFKIAALIGAVLVVTGPTVVAPILRHIRPNRTVNTIIKWEGIVIDPIGAVLAVLVFEYTIAIESQHDSVFDVAMSLFLCSVVAGAIGFGSAWGLVQLLKRFLIPDYLHTVTFLSTVLAAFACANWIHHESGLVTVTVFGIYLANQKQVSIDHIVEFKEGLGVLLISCLFILLGSRVELSDLRQLGWQGIAFVALMIVLVRPLSVMISTIGAGVGLRERIFIGCLAPRGIVAVAVTAVFAIKINNLAAESGDLTSMQADAAKLVPITFYVIIGTVGVYGLSSQRLAQYLGLAETKNQGILFAGADRLVRELAKAVGENGFPVMLVDTNYQNVAASRMAGLPAECVSILSERVYDETDLTGIGRLVAMTPNDELNAMAVGEHRHFFGREGTFLLKNRDGKTGKRASLDAHQMGRTLFGNEVDHTVLSTRLDAGWTVKTTKLTEEFDLANFHQLYGEDSVVLFVVDSGKNLLINSTDQTLAPKAGHSVIAFVDPDRKLPPQENGSTDPHEDPDS